MSCRSSLGPVALVVCALLLFSACDWLFGVDTTPPLCTIDSPSDSAIVSGVVVVQATATDTQGVRLVSFYADGVLLGADSTAGFSVEWDTRSLDELSWHELFCVAEDNSGNLGYSESTMVQVVQGGARDIFHGRIDLPTGYYFPLQFSAQAGDTVEGEFRLTAGVLSRFIWLDSSNFVLFQGGQSYVPLLEEANRSSFSMAQPVGVSDQFHLVFLNTSGDSISCWARFRLE
jgi:hypothetical protein